MTDLYVALRGDCPGVLRISASDNAYISCEALQTDHCFTVRPVAIFCYVGENVSLVHEALESKRLANDWFEVSLREACDTVSRVLAELVHASRDDSADDVPLVCHTGKGRIG
jgi:hypothetical protein